MINRIRIFKALSQLLVKEDKESNNFCCCVLYITSIHNVISSTYQ
jgi:hypothetical protein